MRIQTVILGCAILAVCFIRSSDAACAATTCTAAECEDTANASEPSSPSSFARPQEAHGGQKESCPEEEGSVDGNQKTQEQQG
ncbi:hypothetical protein ACLKA7_010602 [Drosophila subpalustris]